jgi:GxxExxY protein
VREGRVAREVAFKVYYKGHLLGQQRVDRVVDDNLVLETKSTHDLPRAALRQLRSYLKISKLAVVHCCISARYLGSIAR